MKVAYAERDRLSATIQRDVMVHLRGLVDEVRRVRPLLPDRPDQAAERLEQGRADVNTALDEVRSLTRGVYPAVLARRGLTAAIRTAIPGRPGVTQLSTYGRRTSRCGRDKAACQAVMTLVTAVASGRAKMERSAVVFDTGAGNGD